MKFEGDDRLRKRLLGRVQSACFELEEMRSEVGLISRQLSEVEKIYLSRFLEELQGKSLALSNQLGEIVESH